MLPMRWLAPAVLALALAGLVLAPARPVETQSPPPQPPPTRLLPLDEGPSDGSFAYFRAELVAAAKQRDASFVERALHPTVLSSFGEGEGPRAFMEFWRVRDPQSQFWPRLLRVLELGGSFRRADGVATFWAPYVYSRWPDSLASVGSERAAVLSSQVKLFARPERDAPVLRLLAFDIVEIERRASDRHDEPYVRVVTADRSVGYVRSDQVWSPVDAHAGFQKIAGRWKIIAFVEGD
jgi:hypothetical protein